MNDSPDISGIDYVVETGGSPRNGSEISLKSD
jgi:hypothetical protein